MIKASKVFVPTTIDAGRHQGYTRLMSQIVNHALHDFWWGKNLEQRLDALYWLASPDALLYTEVLELESHPLQPILDGKRVRRKRIVL